MLKAISALVSTGAVVFALFTPSASAETISNEPLPSGKVTVDLVSINGSGCARGSTAISVAPDNTAFTVTYSEYLAQAGGNSDIVDSRKNCQLGLQVNVPQGFTYAVAQADYRGYASLAHGATGMQKASYYFQGSSETYPVEHEISGPHSDNWQFTDRAERDIFAPCGTNRILNVNTELRVNAGSSKPDQTSFIVMDSTDGSVSTTYQLSWKEC